MKKIYIVGAHSRSQTLGKYLTKLNMDVCVEAYLVNNDELNPQEIEGVPVIHFDENTILHTDYPVYLGTRGMYHRILSEQLTRMGMKEIISVTPELDMEFRNKYLKLYYKECGCEFVKINDFPDIACIYVVKSVYDKPLETEYILKSYEREIQVGAALTGSKICEIRDDVGMHISDKNMQFCELTGLYWLWKHAQNRYIGMEHYRRHFILKDNWEGVMVENQIDVILSTPLLVNPNIEQNYKNRHVESDWDYMLQALKQIHPEDYESAIAFFRDSNLYSPCNMFIMRKEILNKLCRWMFPIIMQCAEHIGVHGDVYQNRYPGFMAERLMTFYFQNHKSEYRLVYADKNFLM
ncbi:MAG: DUF4422 domain-containing protein [Lachnospira sp.]|nr:DUF4422 domain-containing protein [Lachnospira sp.]